jgi:uncharacterized protein
VVALSWADTQVRPYPSGLDAASPASPAASASARGDSRPENIDTSSQSGENRQARGKSVLTPCAYSGEDMRPRIKIITLGVSDLEKSLTFYRDGMGLSTEGIIGTEFEDGAVVFFDMNDDLILALWPKQSLAKDAKIAVSPPSPSEFSIGHIVKSKQEVDEVMKQAAQAGATITDPARDRFWGGYAGYFQDLDSHLWEIAWNPHWEVKE